VNPKEIEAQVNELEERVERLRALYDQYFQGIEKIEPLTLRKDVDRRLWQLRRIKISNTVVRFRLQGIVQRYNTFQQYWMRICREIENGTYHRDLAKAAARFGEAATNTAFGRKRQAMFEKGLQKQVERQRKKQETMASLNGTEATSTPQGDVTAPEEAAAASPQVPFASLEMPAVRPSSSGASGTRLAVDLPPPSDAGKAPAGVFAGPKISPLNRNPFANPSAPAEPPSRPGPRPVPPPSPFRGDGELSDARLRQIYAEYVEARRQRGESTASLTYENLAKTLRSTVPQIKAKHKVKSVDFEVVVRDGKTMIKPVVKS